MKKFFSKWMFVLLSGSIIASLLVAALPGTAYAASIGQGQSSLQSDFARVKATQRHDANLMNKANKVIMAAENRMTKFQNLGADTSALGAAISDYQAQLTIAQDAWNDASALIAAHAGFDNSGTITDMAQARATLQAIHMDQSIIANALSTGSKAFTTVYSNFLASHKK